ncbi:MAG: hypothetical protein Q8L91_10770 [Polaromonas sp.]|nr:hypothetical protein [Polaromonas sp.]
MGWRSFSLKNEATAPVYIRLLGAPGTGKTQLATELAAALSAGEHAALTFTIEDNPAPPHPGPSGCTTLLMGLDLPVPPASAALQQAADRTLRDTLAQSGIPYQVVYGQGEQRLHSALSALQGTGVAAGEQDSRTHWVWACDNCSDPQCERRLLSDLLATRARGPSA